MSKLPWILPELTRKMTIQYTWSFRQRIRNGQYWNRIERYSQQKLPAQQRQDETRQVRGHCKYRIFHQQGRRKPAYFAFTNSTHTWILLERTDLRNDQQSNVTCLFSSVGADQSSLKPSRRLFAKSVFGWTPDSRICDSACPNGMSPNTRFDSVLLL